MTKENSSRTPVYKCFQQSSLVAQMVKHLPTMWETLVQSLGQEDLLEKEMATHSSILAWKIPWMEKPGRLHSMGLQRVGHDWVTSLSLFTFMHWKSKWQPTPVLLPGETQGREPGGLPSLGSYRVRHDWSDLAAAAAYSQRVMLCRSLPVFQIF